MPRRPAAYSLLELTIASLVLLVAMALAARLLHDVGMQVAWSGRKAIEMSPELALDQLRNDLRDSAGPMGTLGMWQSAPLAIGGSSSGQTVVYRVEDGDLVRRILGGSAGGRKVLDKVTELRYRYGHDAVEVEIEFLRIKPPLRRDVAAGMRESPAPEKRKVAIVVCPRRLPVERF
jgi:hypothetical protein